jgi:hypothetical protein
MMCFAEGADVEMRKSGAISVIVDCLRSKDLEVRNHIICTIRNISTTDENETEVVRAGALKHLILYLDSDNPKIRKDALKAIRNLSFAGTF